MLWVVCTFLALLLLLLLLSTHIVWQTTESNWAEILCVQLFAIPKTSVLHSSTPRTSKFIVKWWKWVLIKTLSTNSVSAPQFELTFIRQISIESTNLVHCREKDWFNLSRLCCLSRSAAIHSIWFLAFQMRKPIFWVLSQFPVFWIMSMSIRSSFPFVSFQHSTFVLISTFSTEFKLHSKKYVMAMFLAFWLDSKNETLKTKGKARAACACLCVGTISYLTNQNLIKCTLTHTLHIAAFKISLPKDSVCLNSFR